MRTIGMLGGMSPESSIEYERMMHAEVRRRLGGDRSADLLIRSYDFGEIHRMQDAGAWTEAGALLARDARRLQDMGASLVILATNTMHKVADAIEAAIDVPFLHIGDVVARAALEAGVRTVGLLGTRFTMEEPFLRARLESHGLTVLVPDRDDRATVHRVIFEELVVGRIEPASRAAYVEIVERLVGRGAEAIVAGCTEIELLLRPEDIAVTLLPSARLHALAAVDLALSDLPPAGSIGNEGGRR